MGRADGMWGQMVGYGQGGVAVSAGLWVQIRMRGRKDEGFQELDEGEWETGKRHVRGSCEGPEVGTFI